MIKHGHIYNRGYYTFQRNTSDKERNKATSKQETKKTKKVSEKASNKTNKSNRARERLRVPPPILSVSPPPEGRNSAEKEGVRGR